MSLNALQFQLQKCHTLLNETGNAETLSPINRGELYMTAFKALDIKNSPLGGSRVKNVTHQRLFSSKGAGYLSSMPLPNGSRYELLAVPASSGSTIIEIVSKDDEILHAGKLGIQNDETLDQIFRAMHDVSADNAALEGFTKYTDDLVNMPKAFPRSSGPSHQPGG